MKRILMALALAAITASSAHAQGHRTKITLGYTGVIDYLAAFVAADQGIFEKHGLDVTLQRMPNGASIPPGLLANSLQIGGITAPVLIQAKAGGFPMKVVAGGSVVIKENPNGGSSRGPTAASKSQRISSGNALEPALSAATSMCFFANGCTTMELIRSGSPMWRFLSHKPPTF